MTFGEMWKLADWAMNTQVAEYGYISQNGTLTEISETTNNGETLLEKNLGLTAYEVYRSF